METVPNESTTSQLKTLESENEPIDEKKTYKWDIYWPNTIMLALAYSAALYGVWIRGETMPQTKIFAIIFGLSGSFGITAGAHRLWCHKTFKMNRTGEVVLLFMASLTYQRSVYNWCRDHRVHHKYSETDADPYSAKRGLFFSHVGWLMVRKHPDVKNLGKSVDLSDLQANPLIMFQHNYYYFIMFVTTLLFPMLTPYYFWGESLKVSFFRGTVLTYIITVNLTWCINSLAHRYGYKPYDKKIGPTDGFITMLLGAGEGFHNYHHTFPWDYRASDANGDIRNLTKYLIDFFAWLGWATERKIVPQNVIEARIAQSGDGSRHDYRTIFEGVISKKNEKLLMNTFYVSLMALYASIL